MEYVRNAFMQLFCASLITLHALILCFLGINFPFSNIHAFRDYYHRVLSSKEHEKEKTKHISFEYWNCKILKMYSSLMLFVLRMLCFHALKNTHFSMCGCISAYAL